MERQHHCDFQTLALKTSFIISTSLFGSMSQASDQEQKQAEEYLQSANREMIADDDNNNDVTAVYEQASQALFNDDADGDWEETAKAAGDVFNETNLPKTLAEMNYKLEHGSIHVRLHEESRDHVFVWVNNRLGKPIHLFRQAMSELLNNVLPEAYAAFDLCAYNNEPLEEKAIVFSKPFLVTPYVKTLVEVSVFKNKLYIFLKRMSKPEAILNSPLFKMNGRKVVPYEGPKIDPDEGGFVPSKGCTVQLDRSNDDPTKILNWAKECITIPY
jgi:hypothetical protein